MNKQDLEKFIAHNLHELAWKNNYPIHEGVAKWSFLNGLRDSGFIVDFKRDPVRIFYVFNDDKNYELSSEISMEEILEGWKQNTKSCSQSLYDSIYTVIDRLHRQITDKYPKWKVPFELSESLSNNRIKKAREARIFMEKYFLEYFSKYYEDVLKPSEIDINKSPQSRILERLLEADIINMDRINKALGYSQSEGSGFSNTFSTIAFLKDNKPLEEDFLIRKSDVFDYVWAFYLLKLAKLKGYKLKNYNFSDVDYGNLEIAFDIGWNILEPMRR